jgi:hypothetical protein
MADDDKPARPFPVEVVVNGVKVTVTLMLKSGVTVEVSAPHQPDDAARVSGSRGPETGTATDSKPGQGTGMDAGQRVPDK